MTVGRLSTVGMLLALLACAPKPVAPPMPGPVGVVGELVTEGPLKQRISTAAADLVVYYGAEHKGSMETCGCPKSPRGSFARFAAYVEASRAAAPDVPSIQVNAGYWLQDAMGFDGQLRSDLALQNAWMVRGSRTLGWDALNVSTNDLAGLATLPKDDGAPLPLVSANASGPGINRWVVINRGGLRIGITGITGVGATLTPIDGYTVTDPASSGAVIDALAAEADVVVLLAEGATDAARELAQHHPAIDLVIDAATHHEYADPALLRHTAWTTANYQTMRIGEVRMRLADGVVTGALARQIDLDPEIPDEPAMLAVQRQARAELDRAQQALYGP